MHLDRYKASGAELALGEARFTGAKTLEVLLNDGGTRTLEGERIFLNLGTHASIPGVPGLAESHPHTHIEILELDRAPQHLIVIGGAYVGLEFAQAYRRFGSRVTIVERGQQLLENADADASAELQQIFAEEGIEVLTSAEILSVEGRSGEQVSLVVRTPQGERFIEASDVLVATGRTPNTNGIGLELAGVALDANGYIRVNERLETTGPNIWAIGECAGSPQFTHAALDDFRIIRDNLAGRRRSTRGRVIPSCLFTDPQLAQIGLTETEAKRRGIAVRVAKLAMPAVLRTRTTGEMRGFQNALVNPDNDRILGYTMLGPEAGEVMAVVEMAMLAGFSYTVLRDAILTHPTMSEGLNGLFATLKQEKAAAQSTGA